MNISIIGAGHVGLVSGACFAELGNSVICVDNNAAKIRELKRGIIPIYEPGLEKMVRKNRKKKRLSFTTDIKEAVRKTDVIFIAVGTPSKENGEADLSFVESVARRIAVSMPSYRLIVEKSTVPVETGKWIEHTIRVFKKKGVDFDVASNPEFLREGSAIEDFMRPDRIVIGVESGRARAILEKLYRPIRAPLVVTDIKSAELIKHASNSFLAAKVSFINAVSNICEKVGADVLEVSRGMGLDRRIGKDFLSAGIGFGGFCLPKDIDAFIRISEKVGYNFGILKEVKKANEEQKRLVVKKIESALWLLSDKTIGVLGLSFKPETDDVRFSPPIDIITMLKKEKAKVKAYDPQAMREAKKVLGDSVRYCKDSYEAARESDCLAVLTEWDEFKSLDFKRIKRLMRQPVILDGRNMYDPAEMRKMGFKYIGIGRC